MSRAPVPLGPDWRPWGERIVDYLNRIRSKLAFKEGSNTATEDGILLWDTAGYPVVSYNGEFKQIVLADGHGEFVISSDYAYAAANTTYELTYTGAASNNGLTQTGSQIAFDEPGHFLVVFSAQIYSTSASTVEFAFWPKINGSNLAGSTMRTALHGNGETTVVARAAIIEVNAGDYLEVATACDSTNGSLKAFAANGISDEPATPATTLTIIRVNR
jgi:hypothetical protein